MSTTTLDRPGKLAWAALAVPLGALVLLLVAVQAFDPLSSFHQAPPSDVVAVERTTVRPGLIELRIRNDSPHSITIAQVIVNDAYWQHSMSDRTISRLESAVLEIPYPWEEGMPLDIAMLTSTGQRISHEIAAATASPETDAKTAGSYALLGVWVGLLPVALGLLWYPVLRRLPERSLAFLLAFTVGLLGFLLVETFVEGVESAGEVARSFHGFGVFALGALVALVALELVSQKLDAAPSVTSRSGTVPSALVAAYFVATGIGLHNLGEGLAVGVAVAAGNAALGATLLVGFAIHNTTEGLAIVAPLGKTAAGPSRWHLPVLAAVAGGPTVLGSLVGGFVSTPVWTTLVFGVAAGALTAVIATVGRGLSRTLGVPATAAGLVAGVFVMYLTGLFT